MRHRFLALVVTLTFAGTLPGPLPAVSAAVCVRCAGAVRCCCAPARGPRACALARPCAPSADEEGAPASQDPGKTLPEATIVAPVPAAPADLVRPDTPTRPPALAPDPPDPPPRLSV